MTRNEMTRALSAKPVEELWKLFLGETRMLQPFWEGAIRDFADRSHFPDTKRDAHLVAVRGAFDKMDGWRHRRVKYVKARRNEIDSAISFIRNKAIERSGSNLRFAPAARNAASALRGLLNTATFEYADHQVAEVIACAIYDIAAVRVLFPFSCDHLVAFHPGHLLPDEIDPFIIMLQRAGKELGVDRQVESLLEEADRIWIRLDTPEPLTFHDSYWTDESDGADMQLHYAAIAAFHAK